MARLKTRCAPCFFFSLLSLFCLSVQAKDWPNNNDFVGSWQTAQVAYRFNYATSIQLELWATETGMPEGLAAFLNHKNKYCIGSLQLDGKTDKLTFSPIDGDACNDLENGYFEIARTMPNNRMKLRYKFTDAAKNKKLNLYNTAYYNKKDKTSASLVRYVDQYKKVDKSLHQYTKDTIKEQDAVVFATREKLKKSYSSHFHDAKLIGVWQGQLIDKKSHYPAEIMLWSSTPYQLHQIVGIIRFEDSQCTTGIISLENPTGTKLSINDHYSHIAGEECDRVHGEASIQMGEKGNDLVLYYDSGLNHINGISNKNCLEDISFDGANNSCYTVGVFERAKASNKLINSLDSMAWKSIDAPEANHLDILLKNKASLHQLQADHVEAISQNGAIEAQIIKKGEIAKEKMERQRRQSWAYRQSQKRIAKKRKQLLREKMAKRRGNTSLAYPPTIHGPFDGLRGGSFLNALYKGDFEAVEQFNIAYQNRKIQQRKSFLGNTPHWTDNIYDAAIQSIELSDTVLAIYLFNYDKLYASCLDKDSATFEVVNVVPDTVTRNVLGMEVARSYGYTSRKQFRVNNQFSRSFRRIGRTQPEGAMSTISDFLLNQGGTDLRRELIIGTKQLMNRFECSSREVLDLESQLLQWQ